MLDRRTVAEDGEGGRMTNFEKLRERPDETIDEVAVRMLIERIKDDVSRKAFNTNCVYGVYPGLFKSVKDWLNSEVEE